MIRERKGLACHFGMKVPHRRCDSHTSFEVKRSKVRVSDGRGHTVSAEPGGHTACYTYTHVLNTGFISENKEYSVHVSRRNCKKP